MDNNGTNRKTVDQVRLRYAPKTAYFFGDVESQCDQKYLEPYVRKILTDLEKQHRIVHTEAVQEAIDVQRNEGTANNDLVLNPLIPFILGHTDQISSREILDYAEQQLNHGREHNKEVAFIDLCLILGNDGRARKYAERSKNQFDLLDILQKEHGTMPDQIMSKTLQMFNLTQDKPNDLKSDLLTQLIIRLIRSRETDIFPDVLTDLARASYPWDALCLASIMTPSKVDFIGEMKKCLRKQIPNNATLFWLDTAGELVKMKDQQAEKIKLKCDGIDPLTAYRIFKIHQHIFHKVDHDELSLQSWAFMAQPIMYKIIVGCLISSQPVLAEDIAQDAAQHIINRKNALWSVQAAPFETIVRMVVCMVTAMRLNNSLKADTIRRFLEVNHDLKSIQQNGIMNYVTSKWLALDLGKRLWQEVLYLPSIQNVTNSLLLVPILLQSNLTCLAVKIMYELASTSQPIPIGGFGQAIAAMAAELKFRPAMCTEIANALSLKFDHNPQSWVAVTEIDQTVESEHTKPAEEPSRFTGQSFVEKIKMTTSPELALENDTAIVADDAAKEESVSVEEESARAAVENKPGSEVPVEESPTVMLSVTEASPMIHTLALSERSDSLPKEQMHIVDPESFEEKQTDWTAVPKQKDANLKTPDMSCPSEDGQYTEESVVITSELADTVQTASAATSLDHLVNNTLQPNDVVEKPKDSTPNDFAVATSIDSKLPEEMDEQPKLTETVVEQPKGFSTGGWDVPDQSVPTQELAGFGTSSTRSAYDNRPTPRQYNDVGHHGPNSYGSGNAPRQSSYGSSYGCRPDRGGSGNMSNGRGGSYSGPRVSRGTRPRGSH